ncbi:hypothetical protein DP939_15945 [Spongiactinospora rosea]|uniref:Uncharacterized protein n=2 Tax=Spongiactinospora rosea TaxID=2248750 RepID=A0A366LZK0_9ACTN|nr:hypothetical protein DP939_15945 [Spongiactinospora rosea]
MGRVVVLAAGFALVAGGCSSGAAGGGGSARATPGTSTSAAPKPAVPRQASVKWADRMCQVTKLLATMKKNSAHEVADIADPPEDALIGPDFTAMGYLSEMSSSLDEVAKKVGEVRPLGIAPADRLHDDLAKEIERVHLGVTGLNDPGELADPMDGSADRAERVGRLIASLETPRPGLAAVTAAEPELSAAYRLAPGCAPPKPLPRAADGTNVGACKDGTCEILVKKQTRLVVRGWTLRVSLTEDKATVRNHDADGAVGEISMAAGGRGTFADGNGAEVTIRAVAVNKDGAVLKIRAK